MQRTIVRPELRAMTPEESKKDYLRLWESKGYHIRQFGKGSQMCAVHPDYVDNYDNGMFDHNTMQWKYGVPGANKAALAGIIVVGA